MSKKLITLLVPVGVLSILSAAGCGASTDAEEPTESTGSAAIYCRQGQDCFPEPTITCDPNTQCCITSNPRWAGPPSMDAGTDGGTYDENEKNYLFQNALRSWGCTVPKAVALDQHGHWWFGSVCPHNSSDSAIIDALVTANSGLPLDAYKGANHCIAPPAGEYVNVIWDPMCPGGCSTVVDY